MKLELYPGICAYHTTLSLSLSVTLYMIHPNSVFTWVGLGWGWIAGAPSALTPETESSREPLVHCSRSRASREICHWWGLPRLSVCGYGFLGFQWGDLDRSACWFDDTYTYSIDDTKFYCSSNSAPLRANMYTSRFADTALQPTLLGTIVEAERISDTGNWGNALSSKRGGNRLALALSRTLRSCAIATNCGF